MGEISSQGLLDSSPSCGLFQRAVHEFGGQTHHMHADVKARQEKRLQEALRFFNGRNATEVVRKLASAVQHFSGTLKKAGGNHEKPT